MPTFLRRLLLINASALLLGFLSEPLAAQPNYTTPYSFTNLAGIPSYGSHDGTGTNARFGSPTNLVTDQSGNTYIADAGNNLIRKLTPDGVVTTLAGSEGRSGNADGPAGAARFKYPRGIARDPAGNLYIADMGNHTIRKLTPEGVVTTIAGQAGSAGSADGTGAAARFESPGQVVVDSNGNLFVADTFNHSIRKITPTGIVTTFAGKAGAKGKANGQGAAASFDSPHGLAIDTNGTLYVADTYNHAIRKITPTGTVSTLVSAGLLRYPYGIAVGPTGTVYVANLVGSNILQISPVGAITHLAGGIGDNNQSQDGVGINARFSVPEGIAIDSNGVLWIADTGNATIRKVTLAGAVTTVAGMSQDTTRGNADGTGPAARFDSIDGSALALNGDIYVTDAYNHTIRKVTPAGVVTTIAGRFGIAGRSDGPSSTATFNAPSGLAVDAARNVYVADSNNGSIRKITPTGIVSTVALGLDSPRDVAVDANGSLYVADPSNSIIRKITPTGVVFDLAGSLRLPGSADGPATTARFDNPRAVAVDTAGNVFVVDGANRTIRKITPAGLVSTFAGSTGIQDYVDGTGSSARFHDVTDIAIDGSNNLYVTEYIRHTIRKITPDGVVSTVAGDPDALGHTDGIGGKALFIYPSSITSDAAGNLIVGGNSTVRRGVPVLAPGFTAQPQSHSVTVGGTVVFSAVATGTPPPTYQWHFNNTAIAGATSSTLTLSNVQTTHAGNYTVVATNVAAAVTSAAATLTVTTSAPTPAPTPTPSGGGGGAPSAWFWSALVVALLARRASRHSQ